ncbi:MAG: hypothetical protein M1840_006246, partial [Geoglossum simile]
MLCAWLQRCSIFTLLLGFVLNVRGQLQIFQDHSARLNQGQAIFLWSSVIRYIGPQVTPGNLMFFAKTAYEEMQSDVGYQNTGPFHRPPMMAAMAIGDHIYFSSSMRNGGHFFSYHVPDTPTTFIEYAVQRCQLSLQMTDGQTAHRTRASCAEVIARYL